MKRINLRSVTESLSNKEMRTVTGGSPNPPCRGKRWGLNGEGWSGDLCGVPGIPPCPSGYECTTLFGCV